MILTVLLQACVNSDLESTPKTAPILEEPPTLLSISPTSGTNIAPPLITLTGRDFLPSTRVRLNQSLCTEITYVSSTELRCRPSTALPKGLYTVSVFHPDGSTSSLPNVYNNIGIPQISAIFPTTGPDAGGTELVIQGQDFTNALGLQVFLGTTPCTSVLYESSTQIKCITPSLAQNDYDVKVVNPDGVESPVFSSYGVRRPVIDSFTPVGGTSAGGDTLTILGSYFAPGVSVTLGGDTCTVTSVDDNEIQCTTPNPGVAGVVDLVVQNAGRPDGTTVVSAFEFQDAPAISSITDDFAAVSTVKNITIVGTDLSDFGGAPTVTIGGQACVIDSHTAPTTITCDAPALAAGEYDVVLELATGLQVTVTDGYTVMPAPTIATRSSLGGPVNGTTGLILTGQYFNDSFGTGLEVLLGATTCAIDTINGAETQVTCDPGDNTTAGLVDLTVNTAFGSVTITDAYEYLDDPTYTSITPDFAPATLDTQLTIVGENFTPHNGGSVVQIGTHTCTIDSITVNPGVNDDEIVCTVNGMGTIGAVNIQITNPSTQTTGAIGGEFSFFAPPTLTTVEGVAQHPVTEGTTPALDLQGSDFLPGTGTFIIRFSNGVDPSVDCASVTWTSANLITCDALPALTAGTYTVQVINPDGQNDSLGSSLIVMGAPTFASMTPNAGNRTVAGETVTITGTNFTGFGGGTTVSFDGVGACTGVSISSSTSLTCTRPTAGSDGQIDITLTNPSGGANTATNAFEYMADPTISAVTPDFGGTNGGESITINGTGFKTGGTIRIGGILCPIDTLNATVITCTTPVHSAGAKTVTYFSPSGNQTGSAADPFNYVAPPSVLSISPEGGETIGAGVVITGVRFNDTHGPVSATIGGVACANVVVNSTTEIECDIPAGLSTGLNQVAVTTPGGTTPETSVVFEYLPTPTVTSVSPTSTSYAGGATLTITGADFTTASPAPTVTINSQNCTSVSVNPAGTEITCTAPANPGGDYTISVTNPRSGLTGVSGTPILTYVPEPSFDSVSPYVDALAGGTSITINGENLITGTTVEIGGEDCTNVIVAGDGLSLTCDTPTGMSRGVYDIVITTSVGSVTEVDAFEFADLPTIDSVSPAFGSKFGGTQITLSGDNFSDFMGDPTVTVDGHACVIDSVSYEEIICTIIDDTDPVYAGVGLVDIVVTLASTRTDTLVGEFEVLEVPTVTSSSPSYSVVGDTSVTITVTGSDYYNFGAGALQSRVFVGDDDIGYFACLTNTVVDANTITCEVNTTALADPGVYTVIVQNPDQEFRFLADSYTVVRAPELTSIAPVTSPVLGGESITLTGAHFFEDTITPELPTVEINGVACTNVVVVDTETITCDTGNCTTCDDQIVNLVDVEITNPGGLALTSTDAFVYVDAPEINPAFSFTGLVGSAHVLSITGSRFLTFGGVYPTVTVDGETCTVDTGSFSETAFDCTIPDTLTVGTHDLVVTNPGAAHGTDTLVGAVEIVALPPTFASLSPVGHDLSGGDITITGTQFDSGIEVLIDGAACTIIPPVTATSVTCTTPLNAGPGPIQATLTLNNPPLGNDINEIEVTNAYEYRDDPTVSAISQAYGPEIGGTVLTIDGTDFSTFGGNPTVTIGAFPCTVSNVSVAGDEITCTTTAGTGSDLTVTVTNASGQSGALTTAYTYRPAPTLASVTPTVVQEGVATQLTLTGTNFFDDASLLQVRLGAVDCDAITLNSATEIVCDTPTTLAPGTYSVHVTTPDSQSASLTDELSVLAAPTLTSVSPASGTTAGGTQLTLTGTNFSDAGAGPTVTVGTLNCTVDTVSATEIVCDLDSTPVAAAIVDVVVENDGFTPVTFTNEYEFIDDPTISSVDPAFGTIDGGTIIEITGTNFSSQIETSHVTIDSTPCDAVTWSSSTTLFCTTPAGASAGAKTLQVQNPNPAQVATDTFTYTEAPFISSVNPDVAPNNAITSITVFGLNFITGATVDLQLGTDPVIPCDTPVVNGTTEIDCDVPSALDIGAYDVIVTNPDTQTATRADALEVNAPPTLSSVTPNLFPQAGGTTITLNGTNFEDGAVVTMSRGGCGTTTFVSATEITCVTTSAATSGVTNITVTNPSGLAVTLNSSAAYLPPPTISSVTPDNDDAVGGASITVNGSNFTPPLTVHIGANPCAVGTVNSTAITCTAPTNTPGLYDVTVTQTSDGQVATLEDGFTYYYDADLSWDVATHDFGSVNTNVTQTFTLTNNGIGDSPDLTISLVSPGLAFYINSNNCSDAPLPHTTGNTCQVSVGFRGDPGSLIAPGVYSTELQVTGPFLRPVTNVEIDGEKQ